MRTFCAILLAGVLRLTYVRALNDCAPFAVNVQESTIERQYPNVNEKYLSLTDAHFHIQGVFRTTHATPITIPTSTLTAHCTAATYWIERCGGVEYAQTLFQGHDEIDQDLLFEAIRFETTFIGYAKDANISIQYKMIFDGHDKHNYIFKWVDDFSCKMKGFRGNEHNNGMSIPFLPDEVINVLDLEFALYSYKPGGYNLYVTCNGKAAWVTYSITDNEPEEMDQELQTDIDKLKNLVRQTKRIELEVIKTNREFPDGLTDYLKNLYPEDTEDSPSP